MTQAEVQVNHQGRVTIPAALRGELGFVPGTTVVAYAEDGRLVLEHRAHLLKRLQQEALAAAARAGESGSAVDDLIADRRAESAREAAT